MNMRLVREAVDLLRRLDRYDLANLVEELRDESRRLTTTAERAARWKGAAEYAEGVLLDIKGTETQHKSSIDDVLSHIHKLRQEL
jgi:hypothetical protein